MSEPAVTRHSPPDVAPLDSNLQAVLLHHEIESFNAQYAQALDEQRLSDWTEMFTDDALYVILSRKLRPRTAGRPDLLREQANDPRPRIRAHGNLDVCAALFAAHHRKPGCLERGEQWNDQGARELYRASGAVRPP